MVLWWIGNVILVLVVLPLVVLLLTRLVKAVVGIGRRATAIHDQAGGLLLALDAVPALVGTRDRVRQVGAGLIRYVGAVDRIL